MAYTLVSTVAGKLNDLLQVEVTLLVDVTDDIEKLSRMFSFIQAVLKDAETRRSNHEAVKTWLQNVKDVAYDVDDILDEWMTEDLRSQAASGGDVSCFSFLITCLLCPVTSFKHVLLRHKIGSRIKEVRGRLHDITEARNQLGLRADSGEGERMVSELIRRGENRERETSSFVNPLSVIGREADKNKVIGLLLQEVTEVPFVISIVGMGGLGKTTLARLIYNDEIVKGHFDMKMLVCVSEDFNVKQITKSIIESATKTGCESLDLDLLQDRLCRMLQAKKFLLVLDDVWSKDSEKWEKLILPFQAGAPGSRIIVTTRIEDVARMMGSTDHMHKLAVLSNEDCWLLFRSKVLEHRRAEECSELEDIGRQIVEKCGGVPLAAKTIGSVMQSRRTRSQWELVLRSEMWNSDDVFEGILPALLLSYYDLPPALKQCFVYCSVFPKDWVIGKDMIVKLWVAQGFICSVSGSGDMEEIGELYFDDLQRRSLLQNAEIDSNGSIVCCKMHDLVHDLAQYVAGRDCSVVEISEEASLNLNNVRHSFIVDNDVAAEEALASISATLPKAHKLRTLLLQDSRISKVPDKLFHHSRCLRALDLSRTDIKKLPETVGQLKHLRYLDLSHTGIEELPEELSNCINLQTLRLNHCSKLRKLPRGMRKMISLRHLEFERSFDLRYLPEGTGRLTELRTLTEFIVGGDDQGCKCGELRHLNHLQGCLPIIGLEGVRSRDEASEAELHQKQHLRALSLKYDDVDGEPLDDEVKRMDDVLESLQPHENLKEIEIQNYIGSELPRWIGNPMFSNLLEVKLSHCPKVKQLPGLGKLPSLKFLFIDGMVEVKKVRGEFSGDDQNDGSGVSFPKLETLWFQDMPNWEEWELRVGNREVMPSLLQLTIKDCKKLTSLPGDWLGQLRALQTLDIADCLQLESLPKELGQLKALQTLSIYYCPQLESLPKELGQLKALQTLSICRCPLESLPKELGQLEALQTLEIRSCQLESLPKELGQLKALQTLEILFGIELRSLPELQHLTMLQQLNIVNCQQLKSIPEELGQLKALRALDIRNCQQLKSLPEELGQLKAPQTLEIHDCPQLKSIPEELGQLKALQTLQIYNCPKLKSLPKELGQLKALQTLEISICPQLKSLPEELGQLKALQTLAISNCPELRSLPEELGQLKALQTLNISNCPQLKSLPEELGQLKALQTLLISACPQLKERYQD
ncbi:putative disease resistance protein RGA3 [Magnolia sinica]|uniref:putative disease resistance protein RGA3 n=1 Tax=Magnolia sinica TaxID=86752 RepID=UPI002657DB3B|nr:putative disease resistance protein RGA3 [Magnolia sinica]